MKRVIKQLRTYIASGDKEAALALLPEFAKAADKAAQHHAIHKNKASRIKSRWMKKVHSL